MDTLFSSAQRERSLKHAPLAVRMRPESLDDYVGQDKAVGPGSWLRRAIEHDVLSSVILYGPAGTGKTTLAHIIAKHTRSEFAPAHNPHGRYPRFPSFSHPPSPHNHGWHTRYNRGSRHL